MSRRAWFSLVLVVAVGVALLSLTYPSVVMSVVSIEPIPSFATYTSQYVVGYPQMSASTFLAGYSSLTAWYPGNPVCDPASNACTPYPTPTATLVYPQSATTMYQVTINTQAASTYTSESTLFSSQTSFQNIPPYAAAGLTVFQFGISSIMIIAAIGLIIIYFNVRKETAVIPEQPKPDRPIMYCHQCGAETSRADKFCIKCGAKLK